MMMKDSHEGPPKCRRAKLLRVQAVAVVVGGGGGWV